jgi:hypothetical protein
MKKTLYQILGVDLKASVQDIEAAYSKRLEELKVATIRDPNKLVVLQQSKEILSDPVQRAAYDVSLSIRDAPAPPAAEDESEPSFLQQWGKWIAAGVVLVGLLVLWPKHVATPPPQKQPAEQLASPTIEPAPQPVQPAGEPAASAVPNTAASPAASAVPNNAASPAASSQPPADSPANPVAGEWSCTDAISGRTSRYNFQQNGALSIASSEGEVVALKYEVSGKVLTLTDPKQVSTLAIEELVARKMILNTGAGGQRVVCTR